MSFLGPGASSSHHRSKSPARSVVTRPDGQAVFVRDKSPARPHAHRSRSEPQGFFTRAHSRSRSRSRSPGGISGFLGIGGSSSKHRSKSPGAMSGFFGGHDRSHSHHHGQSRSRARSPSGFSFFGGGGGRDRSPQSDIRSFFGGGNRHYSSTSRYGRQPRQGFVQKILAMLKRTWRDLRRYAKNNPIKMITLVLMPLLTSGLLVKLLGTLGIKLPSSIASLAGGSRGAPQQSGGYYGSQGYGGPGGQGGGGGGAGGIAGSGIGLGEVMNVAKMFM